MSPRSPPKRRYSRRNGHDNRRRRGEMCHGSRRHCGASCLESSTSMTQKKEYARRCWQRLYVFLVIIVKMRSFTLRQKSLVYFREILTQKGKMYPEHGHGPEPS